MAVNFERLDRMPSVKVAMTPFPFHVDAGASLGEARAMMQEHGIHHLPVTESDHLVGVISEREVALGTAIASARDGGAEPRVRDACMLHAYVVEDTAPLDAVLTHMAEHGIGSAVVVRRGKLVGVFTATDACRHFAAWLYERFGEPPDDVA